MTAQPDPDPGVPGRWGDLLPRVFSGVLMVVLGVLAIWLGGIWFRLLVAAIAAAGIWELARMMARGAPFGIEIWVLCVLSAATVLLASFAPPLAVLPILAAPAVVGAGQMKDDRVLFAIAALAILLAATGLIRMRIFAGLLPVLWLVAVVVLTDVAGYFGGRILGGPKFWPRISPKKTWSGTASGWIVSGLAGLIFGAMVGMGPGLALMSVCVSFASQMGDIAESALKRRVGAKDSSNLIPGHGGVLDRFDGMMGASLFVMVAVALLRLPLGG